MSKNYVIKFYNGSGAASSDWSSYEIHIFCTYEQAERKAKDYMDRHPNIYSYRIIEE